MMRLDFRRVIGKEKMEEIIRILVFYEIIEEVMKCMRKYVKTFPEGRISVVDKKIYKRYGPYGYCRAYLYFLLKYGEYSSYKLGVVIGYHPRDGEIYIETWKLGEFQWHDSFMIKVDEIDKLYEKLERYFDGLLGKNVKVDVAGEKVIVPILY
jgi:hypothetical protein